MRFDFSCCMYWCLFLCKLSILLTLLNFFYWGVLYIFVLVVRVFPKCTEDINLQFDIHIAISSYKFVVCVLILFIAFCFHRCFIVLRVKWTLLESYFPFMNSAFACIADFWWLFYIFQFQCMLIYIITWGSCCLGEHYLIKMTCWFSFWGSCVCSFIVSYAFIFLTNAPTNCWFQKHHLVEQRTITFAEACCLKVIFRLLRNEGISWTGWTSFWWRLERECTQFLKADLGWEKR